MRGFREIRECERPGNRMKETKISEETMKKYNALFADDFSVKTTLEQATKDCIETTSKILAEGGTK